jgi:ABC-type antimicrobial peptide transport system permease subunit
MLSEYLPKNKKWFFINIAGIAIAFAAVVLVSSYTIHELSYDKFHAKADNIYRLQIDKPGFSNLVGEADNPNMVTIPSYGESLYDKFPAIDKIVCLFGSFQPKMKVGENTFFPEKAKHTSRTFFDTFDFKLLKGNRSNIFNNPNEAALSKKAALTYFGSLDIIGKEFTLKEGYKPGERTYTVTAVLDEIPANSHMRPEILFSMTEKHMKENMEPAYIYLLFHKGTNKNDFIAQLDSYWKKNIQEGCLPATFKLIKLTDIHLKSNGINELETNGNINSLIVLVAGCVILLLIALINYSNLNYVQFLTEIKDLKVRIVNGASLIDLSKVLFFKSMLQTIIAIVLGLLLAFYFKHESSFEIQLDIYTMGIVLIAGLFIIAFGLVGILPLYTKGIPTQTSQNPEQGSRKFIYSLVFQFTLSIMALVLTIVFHQQISFVVGNHPGSGDKSILVMSGVPYSSIAKYDNFKELALRNPEILNVSGSTTPPGMMSPFDHEFDLEGFDNTDKLKLTVVSIDEDFFKLLDIKAIAGSLSMGPTSSYAWERIAINPNVKIAAPLLKEFEANNPGFKEQYILNKAAVKMLGFSNPQDVIGKEFKFNFTAPLMFAKGEIIAVIDALHYDSMFNKEKPIVMASKRLFNATFFIRIDNRNKAKAIKILEEAWSKVNPGEAFKYEFLSDVYAKMYRNQNNEMRALTLFAVLSILLSTLGMFALSSYSIEHKTKEIGIKKANGASSVEILLEFIADYLKWIALAFVIASPIAYYIAIDWLSNFAYKVEIGWWIFALSGIIAVVIAIVTVSWQTWNAARKEPVYALKYE